jgi:hypothetical protein
MTKIGKAIVFVIYIITIITIIIIIIAALIPESIQIMTVATLNPLMTAGFVYLAANLLQNKALFR